MDVLYLCNGKACEEPSVSCGRECRHTKDINFAKSFERGIYNGCYIENPQYNTPFEQKIRNIMAILFVSCFGSVIIAGTIKLIMWIF